MISCLFVSAATMPPLVANNVGTNLMDDILRLESPVHILVATPGRIQDLAKRGVAKLEKVSIILVTLSLPYLSR